MGRSLTKPGRGHKPKARFLKADQVRRAFREHRPETQGSRFTKSGICFDQVSQNLASSFSYSSKLFT
jgi:hypothetical protein